MENRRLQDLIQEVQRARPRPSSKSRTARNGSGAQTLPRLCAGEDGHDRRDLVYRAQYPRRAPGLWGPRPSPFPSQTKKWQQLGVEKRQVRSVPMATVGDTVQIIGRPAGRLRRHCGGAGSLKSRRRSRLMVSMFGRETPGGTGTRHRSNRWIDLDVSVEHRVAYGAIRLLYEWAASPLVGGLAHTAQARNLPRIFGGAQNGSEGSGLYQAADPGR